MNQIFRYIFWGAYSLLLIYILYRLITSGYFYENPGVSYLIVVASVIIMALIGRKIEETF